jgi:hypothetical protein
MQRARKRGNKINKLNEAFSLYNGYMHVIAESHISTVCHKRRVKRLFLPQVGVLRTHQEKSGRVRHRTVCDLCGKNPVGLNAPRASFPQRACIIQCRLQSTLWPVAAHQQLNFYLKLVARKVLN